MKNYITTRGIQCKLMCDVTYPNPVYFDRPDKRLSKHHLQTMLKDRADEARRIIDLLESMSDAGITNKRLMDAINVLHDFRVSVGIHSGEGAGKPHLWEE